MHATFTMPYDDKVVTITMIPSLSKTSGETVACVPLVCPRIVDSRIMSRLDSHSQTHVLSQSWSSGNQEFDARFFAVDHGEQVLRQFLSSALQQRLIDLATQGVGMSLYLTHNMMRLRIQKLFLHEQSYQQFISCVCACVAQFSSCTQVHTVRFDSSGARESTSSMLIINSDIATFAMPLFGLTRIEIFTPSYSFHHLERFITYILEELGPGHLKRLVDVDIQGEPALLHQNIRNSLTVLCRHVTESHHV
jgi:hypothetical protein